MWWQILNEPPSGWGSPNFCGVNTIAMGDTEPPMGCHQTQNWEDKSILYKLAPAYLPLGGMGQGVQWEIKHSPCPHRLMHGGVEEIDHTVKHLAIV